MNNGLPDDRFEKIKRRAQLLDAIRGENWIVDEVERLWKNPEEFEVGKLLQSSPDSVEDSDYALFVLALLVGTDYEYAYPRDYPDQWAEQGTSDIGGDITSFGNFTHVVIEPGNPLCNRYDIEPGTHIIQKIDNLDNEGDIG